MLFQMELLQLFLSHKKLTWKALFVPLSISYFQEPLGRSFKLSLAVVLQSLVPSHLQFDQTFNTKIYFYEKSQEGRPKALSLNQPS